MTVWEGISNALALKNLREVRAGDRVLFGKYSGNDITLDGQDLLIMKEEDVLGVIAS